MKHWNLFAAALLILVPTFLCAEEPPGLSKGREDELNLFGDQGLHFIARSRPKDPISGTFEVAERPVTWDARKTALIICDLWDKHWCESATRRTGEMAPRINQLANTLRAKGAFIVHAPSDTMEFYKDAPQRKLAQNAPMALPPIPIARWNYIDLACEAKLPIDDSDGGCDDQPQCRNYRAWKREHPAVQLAETDAVSDNGVEIYNLFARRGIKHVLLCGVHANMCVLGRSFGIRQLVREGFDVALVRDLTDTMYNPRQSPAVPHARGTDLVVKHVETYWASSLDSGDLLGDRRPPHVVFAIAEQEYNAKETLPAFAKAELEPLGIKCTFLQSDKTDDLPGTEVIKDADLLVVYMRRRTLPEGQLAAFKAHFEAGKPVIGLRTASHAFQNYLEFDKDVLGGNYQNHFSNKEGTDISAAPGSEQHVLLRGVEPLKFHSAGTLYKNSPLSSAAAAPLLMGRYGESDSHPVAWTNAHLSGKVFYTSLGAPEDFQVPQFRRLLKNAVLWSLEKPVSVEVAAVSK